jgi:ABC-type multidrug transport system fused ATPase/permease subunit
MTVTQATRGTGRASSAGLAVETRGLTKSFGARTVVDKVDLAIPAGSVCGFVGPNGAGKPNLGNWQFFAGVRCFLPLNGEPTG